MTSRHPDDIERGYCGNCHDFTRGLVQFATALRDLGAVSWGPLQLGEPGSKMAEALARMAADVDAAAVSMARTVAAALLADGGDEMRWAPGDPEL
jgi:hypothetical protein